MEKYFFAKRYARFSYRFSAIFPRVAAGKFLKHTAVRRNLEKIAGKIIKVLFFREF